MATNSIPVYDATVGVATHALQTLQALLKKAQAHPDAASFSSTRIAPDMLPFAFQVLTVSNNAKKIVERLAPTKADLSVWEDNHESTLDELVARVEKTLALLATVEVKDVELKDQGIKFGPAYPNVPATGGQYVLGYVLPNLFFHLSMAYAILRMKGVELGKADYLGPFVKDFFPGSGK